MRLLTFVFVVFVVVRAQRFGFVPNAENFPSGRVISNDVTGLSGTAWKVVLVTPWGLM